MNNVIEQTQMDALKRTKWISLQTIVRKETKRIFRIWIQSLIPPVITTVLYFTIFGNLIGPRIGAISTFSYVQFITPGLIMLSVINSAYANVVASFYGARWGKSIEELLVSPTPHYMILLGYVAGGVVRSLIVGLLVTLVSLFFTHLQIHHLFIMCSMVLLTAILFSLAGFANAIFAKNFDDITVIPTFVLTPLTYLGGIFYSIDMLPPFWRKLSFFNPILHMVNAFRYGILGISDIPLGVAFSIVILFSVGLFVFNLQLLKKGVGIRS